MAIVTRLGTLSSERAYSGDRLVLSCGPEVVVARLAAGQAGMVTPLVRVRAAWGAFRKRVWKV